MDSRKTSAISFFPLNVNAIISLMLALTGALFILKYAGRHGLAFIAVLYFIGFLLVAKYFLTPNDTVVKFLSRKLFISLLVLISVLAFLTIYILPENSRVARLPAISEWIDRFLRGEFPYGGPMNPSGFPALFFFSIPFYYLGNIGILEVIGILLFGIAILKSRRQNMQIVWIQFLILLLLPTFYYEVITRSELFFNMSLALAVIIMSDVYLSKRGIGVKFIGLAITFGLVLSTRLIVGSVYAVFVIYKFRRDLKNGLIFSAVVVITFVLTLLPFLVWNAATFMSEGPFRMQFSYLPVWGIFVTVVATIICGFKSENLQEVIVFSGIIIFGAVTIAFFWAVYQIGFIQAVFDDRFDIGYFILSVPFLLFGFDMDSVVEPLLSTEAIKI